MTAFQGSKDPLSIQGKSLFEFWLSFWPVAPYFGVEWQFAPMFTAFKPLTEAYERQVDGFLSALGDKADKALNAGQAVARVPLALVPEATKPVVAPVAPVEAAKAPVVAPAPLAEAPEAEAELTSAEATPAADPVEPPRAATEAAMPAPSVSETIEDEVAALDLTPPASLLAEAPADPDDLKQIKGIGPKLETQLNELGVYRLDQIAGFSAADLAWLDASLPAPKGRCFRDGWVDRAKEIIG